MSKFAIISDIHGNLEALQAVLQDIQMMQATSVVCLGDIVGYNANPAECLELIRSLDCPVIKGNHDEEAASDNQPSGMNPIAGEALIWTRNQLSEEQKEWIRRLRMVRNVPPFTIVHSTLDQPALWHYIINKFDAASNFNFQFTDICFHGHTHVPKIFIHQNGTTEEYAPEDFAISPNAKYFVNVGSVGQPRDGINKSSYAIYDSDDNVIYFRRVDYDIETAQRKIIEAGLPAVLAERLGKGN